MLAILKRETKSYFTGMIGYVVVAVFLAVLGLYFTNQNLMFASPDFGGVLYTCTILLLFLLPALSMRSFAEERRAKTDQLLLTSPVSIPGIVLGKFLAQMAVFCVPLLAAAVMPLILTAFGRVNLIGAYASLLGFVLLGAACISIGTFLSSLTENQIIAYLSTFGVLLVCYLMNGIRSMFTSGNLLAFLVFTVVLLIAAILVGVTCKSLVAGAGIFFAGVAALFVLFTVRPAWLLSAFNAVLSALALFDPFTNIVSGIFSLTAMLYYLSVTALFLFLTGQTLERRRWN